jgi:leucyl aminopeptidase
MAPLVCFADAPTDLSSLNWTFDGTDDFKHYLEVTMLGFLEACYEPIDVRNSRADIKTFTRLGFVASFLPEDDLIQKVQAIEEGRRVCKGKTVA